MSIFNSSQLPFRTRVSLLEERLSSYDEVSKQMLNKLEQAVEKISESNKNISQILIRHDERIDRAAENNTALIALLSKTENELRDRIEKSVESVNEQVETNSVDIGELKKSKWIWVGIISGLSFIFSQIHIISNLIHPQSKPHTNAEYVRTF